MDEGIFDGIKEKTGKYKWNKAIFRRYLAII